MFARSSKWTGSPEELTRWADNAPAVAEMVAGLAGNAGALFLLDRQAGTALTVTVWDSEDAALVSDRYAEASRCATVAATGVELADRSRYEVVLQDLR